jgi:hypothetical protein
VHVLSEIVKEGESHTNVDVVWIGDIWLARAPVHPLRLIVPQQRSHLTLSVDACLS